MLPASACSIANMWCMSRNSPALLCQCCMFISRAQAYDPGPLVVTAAASSNITSSVVHCSQHAEHGLCWCARSASGPHSWSGKLTCCIHRSLSNFLLWRMPADFAVGCRVHACRECCQDDSAAELVALQQSCCSCELAGCHGCHVLSIMDVMCCLSLMDVMCCLS